MEMDEMTRYFVEQFKPTPEDIARHLTNDELVELCRRRKCRVDAWRWNQVNDYVEKFRSQDRLQHKTLKQANALLAKAVNRYKDDNYKEAEIQKAREHEWRQRKKDNIMSLNTWAYDRKEAARIAIRNQEESSNADDENEIDPLAVRNALVLFSEDVPNVQDLHITNAVLSSTQSQNTAVVIDSMESLEGASTAAVSSQHSVISLRSTQTTQSQRTNVNIGSAFMNLNSESMTCVSQDIQCSELEIPCSEPADYTEFNTFIPCTSTQSQSQGLQF